MIKKLFTIAIFLVFIGMPSLADEISVKLTPLDAISTADVNLREGDNVNFVVVDDVYVNSKLFIKRGTLATGVITNLVDNGFTCQEASIYAENFKVKNAQGTKLKLDGIVYKQGRNHSYFTQFLADFFCFIRGGEVKIVPVKDTYTLYVKGPVDDL